MLTPECKGILRKNVCRGNIREQNLKARTLEDQAERLVLPTSDWPLKIPDISISTSVAVSHLQMNWFIQPVCNKNKVINSEKPTFLSDERYRKPQRNQMLNKRTGCISMSWVCVQRFLLLRCSEGLTRSRPHCAERCGWDSWSQLELSVPQTPTQSQAGLVLGSKERKQAPPEGYSFVLPQAGGISP